jgi:transcriptional regulator with XRE-family HTH domain
MGLYGSDRGAEFVNGSMGERIAWARNQQGMILQQVSDKSGLAIGYISQLEKGAKVNPTIDALKRLADALHVSVAFILGEVQAPPYDDRSAMLIGGQAWTVGQRFVRHYESLSRAERERLQFETVEQRFARVVDFLCDQFPAIFTRAVVAYQLGLSVRALNDILERDCEVGPVVLSQMVSVTGIPISFFAKGQTETVGVDVSPAQMIQYAEAIGMAADANITPDQLVVLIREFNSRK